MSYFLATHAVIPASRRRVRAICRNYRVNMATDRPSERVGFLFVRGLDGRVLSLREISRGLSGVRVTRGGSGRGRRYMCVHRRITALSLSPPDSSLSASLGIIFTLNIKAFLFPAL